MTATTPEWAREVPEATRAWIADACGAPVAGLRLLPSAFAANHVADLADGRSVVLRRWARPGWDDDDPDLSAAREALVLGRLADAPLPAPALLAADAEGERADVPALLLTLLPGRPPQGPPVLGELVRALDTLHAIDPDGLPPYAPYLLATHARVPSWAGQRETWELAIDVARRDPPDLPARFIHRDPHPGNTLWDDDGRLSGLVDWTTGAQGPAAIDLAHLAVNLALRHGIAASGALAPHPDRHPYWDVAVAVDFAPSLHAPDALQVARVEAHMRTALAELAA